MQRRFTFVSSLLSVSLAASAQITLFSEDFDGIGGPTAGGAGTYSFPTGWVLLNADNLTPDAAVSYVNAAWERREDFANNVADSAAFSTSWYAPAGTANDWMWTPAITLTSNCQLSWNAIAYDPSFLDGYEVRVWTAGGTPTSNTAQSTVLQTIAAENSTWTARTQSLAAYSGQTVRIGFRNNSIDKFLLLIDDVTVTGGPVNDNCSGAISMTVNAQCTPSTFDVAGATQSLVGCSGTANDDIWFSFVMPTSGVTNVEVLGNTGFDAVMEFYDGTCGALASIGCLDATLAGEVEAVQVTGVAGTTIYYRVYDSGSGVATTTDFIMCVYEPVLAPNDECITATPLSVGVACNPTTGDVANATESQAGCAGTADDDVWYSFVVPASGTATIDVQGSTSFDAVVEAFEGTCGALTSIGCVDGSLTGELESAALTNGVPGATLYLRVYDYASGLPATTDFTICIYDAGGLANDDCSGATSLTVGTSCLPVTGDVTGATESQAGCAGTADDDVWYSFVVPANGAANIEVLGSTSFDAVLEVFEGTCGALTSLGCLDNTLAGETEAGVLTGATPGATIFVRVYDYNTGVPATTTFDICVYGATLATNDDVCSAIPLSFGANGPFVTTGATAQVGEPVPPQGSNTTNNCESQDGWCSGDLVVDNSVWFTFVAPVSGNVTINTDGSYDTQLAVYSAASCTALTSGGATLEGANDDNPNFVTTEFSSEVTVTCLTAGQTYYVQVDGYQGASADLYVQVTDNQYVADATITPSSPSSCNGNAVTISGPVGTGFQYAWAPSGQTTQSISVTSGTHTLTVTDSNGCTRTSSATVTTGTSPTAGYTFQNADPTVNFTDQSTGGATSYSWDFGDGGSSTSASPSHTYSANGTYTVCLTATNDCGSDQDCQSVSVIVTGLSTVEPVSVAVYPNPSVGELTVELKGALGHVLAEITDLSGRKLFAQQLQSGAHIRQNLSVDLASGTYMLNIIGAEGLIATQRIAITR